MEGVPRMPMISFDLKTCPEPCEFTPALKRYISEFYHENPDSYSKECSELDQLRQAAVQVTIDFVGCSVLKKYFAQLQFLQSRFPLENGEVAIPFTWEDAFTRRPFTNIDVKFEISCILYNIGALHSMLGSMDNRSSPEGMKVSCTHFQCAAWAFQHLRDNFDSSFSPDMNYHLLTYQSTLMLAQAQECILEKSMTDNRKSSITAKVAAQIVEYYKQAAKSLDASNASNVVGSKKFKDWRKRLDLKVNFYDCIMYFYLGLCSDEQQKWGERVTYCQAALDRLNESMQLVKKSEDTNLFGETMRFAMDVVGGKYNSVKKDNDLVYHDKVPPLDSLPEVKGASLVKGIPFNPNDPEVSGSDIFKKLVPLEAHKASSLYSEEKAKLLRKISALIEDKNRELGEFMSSLQIDSAAQIIPEPQKLPQALVEKCAAISVRPNAIKDLIDAMQSLSGIATDVEVNIRDIKAILDEEEQKEKDFQAVYGSHQANSVVAELRNECTKYQEGLDKASQSNEELHRAMEIHIANLRLLSGSLPELQKALPSAADIERSEEDKITMQEMKRLYDKVGEMKTQRQNLEQQLRDALQKDDLTSTLVLQGDKDQQEFFKEQLHKHDKTVSLIDQNLLAQGNILRVLTETNAKYGRIRKENADCTRQREAKINDMIQSYDVYTDLLSKTERGRQFYGKLDTKVKHLLERTQEGCRGQQEERNRILERLAPKVPPPARPTAPKPGQPQLPAVAPYDMQFNMNLPNSYMPVQNMPMMPPVGPEPPKLKDFLPFMKPGTFGPKSRAAGSSLGAMDCAPGSAGSLPPSISASPVHIPHGPVSLPPSPQRQPVPAVTSNGYASVPGSMPISSTAGAGVMSADSLLSPTAPPGAPRSSSPAHQPQMPMHPGGPAESHMHQYGGGQEPPNSWHQSMQTSVYPPSLDSRVPASSGVALPTSAEAQGYNPSSTGCSQPGSWSNVATVQGPIYSSSGMTGVGLPQVYPSDHLRQYGGVTVTGVGITGTLPQTGGASNRSQADTWFASQHQPGRLPDVVDSGQKLVSGGSSQLPVSSGAAGGFNAQQRLASTNTAYATYPTGTVGGPTLGQNIQQPGDGRFMQGGFGPASQSMSGPQFSAPLPGNSSVQGGYMVGPGNVYQSGQAVSQAPPSYSTVCSSNLAMQPTHPPMSAQSGYLPVQSGAQVPGNFSPGQFAPVPTGTQAHPTSQVPIHSQQQHGPGSDYTSQGFSAVRQPSGQNVQQPLGYLPTNQPQPGGITYPMVSHTQPQVLPTNRPYSGPGPQSQAQPLQYASNIQNQPQYPVPSQTFPGQSASGQQMTRYPAVSQSGYPGGGHPSAGYPQAPGGAVHPGVPQPGYPASAQQQSRYPMPNQPVTSQTQQPYPVRFQQPQDFSGAPQPQIPLTNQALPYPAAGQPPYPQEPSQRPGANPSYAPYQHQVKGQVSAFQPTGQQIGQQVAYPPTNQQHPGYAPAPNNQPQNVYQQSSSYQQNVGGNPNGHSALPQSFPASNQPMMQQPPVSSVPGTMQASSQAAEIIPACLPSPLQPSRAVTSIISKGVESLRDLDLTTSTTTQSTGTAGGGDFQNVSQPCTVDKTSMSSGVKGFDDSLDKGAVSTPALQPEVVSAEEQRERREEETRRSLQHSRSARDPYSDADAMARFSADVEKFQKHVDALLKPTLGGYLPLDKEWKDVNEDQDKTTRQFSMAIARCYPMKNRFADVMPFDSSRVVLTGAADDYINASHLGSFSVGCPNFIATQAPLPATFVDFWQMVYDQGTETIVALCVEQEPGSKNHMYWPVDKGQSVVHGAFTIALQSSKNKQAWIERILTISHKTTHQSRSIVHLQFLCWPPAGVPESPAQLLQFVIEVQSFYRQQRSLTKPIIVHCSNGIGRTGAFCVVYIGVDEIDQGDGVIQVLEVVSRLRRQRRSMVQYKEQLKFCYDTILCYAQDLLMRHGVLVSRTLAGKLTDRSLGRVPSEDLVLGLPNLSAIQSSVAKMNVRPPRTQADSIPSETPISEAGSRSENASVDSSEGLSASVEMFGRTSEEKSRSSSPCSVGSSSVGLSPQHHPAVEQQRIELSPSLTNLPPSLMDLQNPANFQLEASTSAHRKITKASFFDPSRPSLGTSSSGPTDGADPLSQLDPLWTLKGN